ncbi:MAG: mechanosensitive ion channel family protein [Pseudomonadales bacterium]|nr:mechanosensitive ion channel family protein [Pseudomonadales bacterium]HAO55370.1 mechanosensitive ion channel protein MscS [Gammaproteobacteria bacterium]|tara:strand:- start:1185 stop:2315 length:1131 start_codon:yes stop_codon:yes gene_type:complete
MIEVLTGFPGQTALWVFSIVFVTLIARYGLKRVLDKVAKQLTRTQNPYDDALLEAARKPFGWGIWLLGISWAFEYMLLRAQEHNAREGLAFDGSLLAIVEPFRSVAAIVLISWFASRFIRFVEQNVSNTSYRENPIDATTANAVAKLLRAAVLITAGLLILQNLGVSIGGVLAFGGIGGIAIGFAARDLLANFFGALMIFLDRPFSVGDWIRSPDRDIEGTVEEIGWRLTRIRTFDQRPLYVPNAVFASLAVENPERMLNRRIYETVGVRYDDTKVLPDILEGIRAYLIGNDSIDKDRVLMVNLTEFGPSSVNFFIYTFTKTIVWTEYHEIKESVLLKIADIIESHGAEIAFPTQTVHLIDEGNSSHMGPADSPEG